MLHSCQPAAYAACTLQGVHIDGWLSKAFVLSKLYLCGGFLYSCLGLLSLELPLYSFGFLFIQHSCKLHWQQTL